jgi:hypothetical protein
MGFDAASMRMTAAAAINLATTMSSTGIPPHYRRGGRVPLLTSRPSKSSSERRPPVDDGVVPPEHGDLRVFEQYR